MSFGTRWHARQSIVAPIERLPSIVCNGVARVPLRAKGRRRPQTPRRKPVKCAVKKAPAAAGWGAIATAGLPQSGL